MIVVKGTRVAFDMKGRRHGPEPDIVCHATYGLMRDPDGRAWPRCSALVGPFRRGGPEVESAYARRWMGRRVVTRKGAVTLPPRALSAWKVLGEVEVLYYLRPGSSHPGMYKHAFNKDLLHKLVFGKTKVLLRRRGRFYRIEMGDRCTIDDRGFVAP